MTIATTTQDTQVSNLLALDHDDFHTLVRNNLGKETPALLWNLLASPPLARRTYTTLTSIYTDVCGQLAERTAAWQVSRVECHQRPDGKEAWFAGLREYNEWRRRALGYKRLLSGRLAEIKQALPGSAQSAKQQLQSSMNPDKKVRLMDTVFKLGWAIREHHERCLAADIIPEPHDTDLWEALAEVEVQTEDGAVTVADMLDEIAAKPGFVPPAERAS